MYEIIQYKADDEFYYNTKIEKEQLEKLRAQYKRDTRATTMNEDGELMSLMSSQPDDGIPGMLEMSKQVEARISKDKPQNNFNAVESFLSSFEPM